MRRQDGDDGIDCIVVLCELHRLRIAFRVRISDAVTALPQRTLVDQDIDTDPRSAPDARAIFEAIKVELALQGERELRLSLDRNRACCDILLRFMKLSSRNRSTFLIFLVLGFVTGTLAWEVLERIVLYMGIELDLGIGPIGFDLSVIRAYIKVNPGSFIGGLGAIVLFRLM